MARTGMVEALTHEQETFIKSGQPVKKESKEISKVSSKLITFSSKIDEACWNALRKASLDRKISKEFPGTQQEIINVAIAEWLKQHDYLE
jgi:hypothetical protein